MNRQILEMYINYQIVVQEIENPLEPQIVYKGKGFHVRSFPLKHSRVCVGYVLEEDVRPGVFHPERAGELGVPRGPMWSMLQNGKPVTLEDGRTVEPAEVMGTARRGRKFSYVTDSLPVPAIPEQVGGSDLLICEGMFERDLAESAHSKRHMTAEDAGRIAQQAGGVKKMGLIHYSPRYTERELKKLLHEARQHFPDTFLTRDRQNIAIPNED